MDQRFEQELRQELTSIFGASFSGIDTEEFTDRDGQVWVSLTILLSDKSSFSNGELLMRATAAVRRLEREYAVETLAIPNYTDSTEYTGHAA